MVEIVETSFVVPSEETPKHSIWLSNIDKKNVMDYVPVVYVYRPSDGLDQNSSTGPLKQALVKALVHFYPLAGRLELDPNDRSEITCTGDGVPFVVGRYDRSVDDFGDFPASPEMRRLLVPSVESAEPPSAVLFMVQSPEEGGGVYVPVTLESEVMEMFKKVFYKELELLNGDSA